MLKLNKVCFKHWFNGVLL